MRGGGETDPTCRQESRNSTADELTFLSRLLHPPASCRSEARVPEGGGAWAADPSLPNPCEGAVVGVGLGSGGRVGATFWSIGELFPPFEASVKVMPNSERHGSKKDGSGGASGTLQSSSGGGSSNSRERHRLVSKHKRHKSKHSKDLGLVTPEAASLGTIIKPLVEYDDISSDSDTFSDDMAFKVDRRETDERRGTDRGDRLHKHRHHQHRRSRDLVKTKQTEKEKKQEVTTKSGSTKDRLSGSSKRSNDENDDSGKAQISKSSSNKESRSAKLHKERTRKERELKSGHKDRSKSHRKRETPKSYKTVDSPKRRSRSPHRKYSDSPKPDDSPSGASYGQDYDVSPPRSHTSSNYDSYKKSPGSTSRRQSVSPPYKEPSAYQSSTRSPSPYSRRQRSVSPYSRRRSSSYERSGSYSGRSPSPYGRRRSSSPFLSKRSLSRSPLPR